jgi:chloramphenicol-sensitive protein RarD
VKQDLRAGVAAGVAAYALWGSFPLYFRLLEPTGALEILSHRILWSLLVVGAVLVVRGDHSWIRTLGGNRWRLAEVAAAAGLIAINWLLYVWAVNAGQVVDASLGYFINPLVTVSLGVLILGERLRRLQWVAVGLGACSVAVITIGYGRFPWVAAALAVSFAGYGFLKRRTTLRPEESLAAETTVLVPVAVVGLVVVAARSGDPSGLFGDGLRFASAGLGSSLLLVSTGVVTATPLWLFAAAAQRIPLSMLGLLQYLTPAAQFVIGVAVFDEAMPVERLVGFLLVWAALALLALDAIQLVRRQLPVAAVQPRLSAAPPTPTGHPRRSGGVA